MDTRRATRVTATTRTWSILVFVLSIAIACGGPTTELDPPDDGPGDTPPPRPTGVTASVEEGLVTVRWDPIEGLVAEALVLRSDVHGPPSADSTEFELIAVADAADARFDDTTVAPGGTYIYAIAFRVGERVSATTEQAHEPVTVDGRHPHQAIIDVFEASPDRGTAPLSVTFSWALSTDAPDVTCRLDLGDGSTVDIADCSATSVYTHTYGPGRRVAIATLTADHAGSTDTASRGIALDISLDDEGRLAILARNAAGIPAAGRQRLFGNVDALLIAPSGSVEDLQRNLDEHGHAVVVDALAEPRDLAVILHVAEDYTSVVRRVPDVVPGTLHIDTEDVELARLRIAMAEADHALGAAHVFHHGFGPEAHRPIHQCCMSFAAVPGVEELVHIDPDTYTFIFVGAEDDHTAFFVADSVTVDGAMTLSVAPGERPHGLVTLDHRPWAGVAPDFTVTEIIMEASTFWPGHMDARPLAGDPAIQVIVQRDVRLTPATYRFQTWQRTGEWTISFSGDSFVVADGGATRLAIGGTLAVELFLEGTLQPDTTVHLRRRAFDPSGFEVVQVFTADGTGPVHDALGTFRVWDPSGVLIAEIAERAFGGGVPFDVPSNAAPGTYVVQFEWDIGPFAEHPIVVEAPFTMGE